LIDCHSHIKYCKHLFSPGYVTVCWFLFLLSHPSRLQDAMLPMSPEVYGELTRIINPDEIENVVGYSQTAPATHTD
jgi:hypothetical protein